MVTQVQKTQTQTRTTKNSQRARLSTEPRSYINPVVVGESVFLRSGILSCPVTANEVSVKEKIVERN